MSKGLWTMKDAGCLPERDLTYESASRVVPKRPQQWLMDSSEAELFSNKKQAVEVQISSGYAGMQPSTVASWDNMSGFNSIPNQPNDRLFDTNSKNLTFGEKNIPPINADNENMGRDPFGNASSFGLSMSPSLEDPKLDINYGGIRKVKVSEVRESENTLPISVGSSYTGEATVISTDQAYDDVHDSGISMGLTYCREDNDIVLGESYGREGVNLMSMGQCFIKEDENTLPMGIESIDYDADCSSMPMGISFTRAEKNIVSMAESFSEGSNSVISLGNSSKGVGTVISMSQAFKIDGCIPVSTSFNIGNESVTSMARSNQKGERHVLSTDSTFDKGESNIISFGGQHDIASVSGRLNGRYDLLMGQTSGQQSKIFNQGLVLSNGSAVIGTAQVLSSGIESATKKKEDHKSAKKIPPNNFPSNVRSLLSTGILDEVPVKYIAWSREKELHGIIKGSGYLCGCQLCNFSKVINAYEFERHAGSKTKHPNNHIYFENGKTIYGIVQELRSTPQNMLFDVIQTISGSPINQKSFRLWKESFLAATRELQRIYGKDERNQLL